MYRVTAFTRAGGVEGARVDDGAPRWLRLAVDESGEALAIQRADGTTQRFPLTIDAGRGVWTFQAPEYGAVRLEYRVAKSGVVTLDGTIGAGPVQVVLRRLGKACCSGAASTGSTNTRSTVSWRPRSHAGPRAALWACGLLFATLGASRRRTRAADATAARRR